MAGTKAGGAKGKMTIYEKYGPDFYRNIGRKGGQNGRTGGFFGNHELAVRAGRKGGYISRRGNASTSAEVRRAQYEEEFE